MKRIRESTVRVTAVDGTTWEGQGDGLARAVRDLGRRHRAGQPAPDRGEARWCLTLLGRRALAHARLFGPVSPVVPGAGATEESRP